MIPGGNLRDVEAVAKHFYYEGQRSGSESQLPLIFMGTVTTAIGATMLYTGGKKLWADWVKDHAKAHVSAKRPEPTSHTERAKRRESRPDERER